jgi:hypothetical protein
MVFLQSVIVDNLDIESIAILEPVAHASLIVDADAALPSAINYGKFQPVVRRNPEPEPRFL